jgi:ribosomal protein S18 acetylase RimI-like enzyme
MSETALREFDLARDYEAVLELWRASGPGVRIGASDTPAEIARKLARDPDLFLVAEADGRIVGTVLGGFDGRRGLVYHLAVAADVRRQRLGRALMAELEARLRAKGCRKAYLLVTDDNVNVIGFYQQLGWQVMPVEVMGKELHDDRQK